MYYSKDDNFKWKTNTDPDSMMPRDKYGFEVVSTGQRVLKGQCPVGTGNTTYFCNAHDTAMFWTSDEASTGDPSIATGINFTEDVPQVGKMPMFMGGAPGGPGGAGGPGTVGPGGMPQMTDAQKADVAKREAERRRPKGLTKRRRRYMGTRSGASRTNQRKRLSLLVADNSGCQE